MEGLISLNNLILNEFSSSEICGKDYKYEDIYLLIEQEIDKEFSVTQDSTDWKYVYNETLSLLENETKDLKLASWWIFSAWKEHYWEALELNLPVYLQFIQKFGIALFPKSLKGKANILFWLEEQLTKELLSEENKKKSINYVLLFDLFNKLKIELNKLLDSDKIKFKKIIEFLKPFHEEELLRIEKENIEKQNIVESEVEKKQEINQSSSNKEELFNTNISKETDFKKLLIDIKKSLSLLGKHYREIDIKDIRALRIARFLSWFEIDELPYAEGKKTFLYPPSELEIDELNELIKEENYKFAISLLEEIIEVCPFWLDGHFIAYDIYTKINSTRNANEVKNSLVSFVKINEGILDFYFNDNTPFCSNKTKKWIMDELYSSNIEEKKEDSSSDEKEKELEKIFELANNDKLKEAMDKMLQNYNKATITEDRFNWRLAHAQLAVDFDKKDIGLALLEELQEDIEKFNLDEWNPNLSSKVYTLILNSYSSVDIPYEKLELIYKKLCKTDINSAFEINLN